MILVRALNASKHSSGKGIPYVQHEAGFRKALSDELRRLCRTGGVWSV